MNNEQNYKTVDNSIVDTKYKLGQKTQELMEYKAQYKEELKRKKIDDFKRSFFKPKGTTLESKISAVKPEIPAEVREIKELIKEIYDVKTSPLRKHGIDTVRLYNLTKSIYNAPIFRTAEQIKDATDVKNKIIKAIQTGKTDNIASLNVRLGNMQLFFYENGAEGESNTYLVDLLGRTIDNPKITEITKAALDAKKLPKKIVEGILPYAVKEVRDAAVRAANELPTPIDVVTGNPEAVREIVQNGSTIYINRQKKLQNVR